MANASVAADVHESLDVLRALAAQVAFHGEIAIDSDIISPSQGSIVVYDSAQQINVVATTDTTTSGYLPRFDGSYVVWASPSNITSLDYAYEGGATISVTESGVAITSSADRLPPSRSLTRRWS